MELQPRNMVHSVLAICLIGSRMLKSKGVKKSRIESRPSFCLSIACTLAKKMPLFRPVFRIGRTEKTKNGPEQVQLLSKVLNFHFITKSYLGSRTQYCLLQALCILIDLATLRMVRGINNITICPIFKMTFVTSTIWWLAAAILTLIELIDWLNWQIDSIDILIQINFQLDLDSYIS